MFCFGFSGVYLKLFLFQYTSPSHSTFLSGIFSLYKCIYRLFRNKSDDYLYLYIRNLGNSRIKPGFRYTIPIYICVGRLRIRDGYCEVENRC